MDALPRDFDDERAAPTAHDWHPGLRFAPRIAPARLPRRLRLGIGIGVVALHVLAGWLVAVQMQPQPLPHVDDAMVVDYIVLLPPQEIRPERQLERPERVIAAPRVQPRAEPALSTLPATPKPAAADAPLQLYTPDGALRLPDGLMESLDAQANHKQFDFQFPNLEAAATLLDRPPPIEYRATRFDEYWAPNDDLLEAVLNKAIEKTTATVRIPVPGAPGRFLVCKVVFLAAGGGCVVERVGGYGRPGEDDPATLSPDEAKACQAWWDKIVGASTQSEWRATRKLYEDECRKPLLKVPPAAEEPSLPEPAQ
jgi:hypothetical protein